MIIKKQGLVSASHSEFTLEALRQIAPSAFIEVRGEDGLLTYKINFDVLRELLGDTIADTDEESFGFPWVGKQTAKRAAAEPTRQTLRPVVEDSKDWDNTENLYIEGDNLEVLKLLQRAYLGKVKMIYIDPPYNTGNDFVYDDDFAMSSKEMDEAMGNLDEDGNRLRKNLDTNPRYHSDWCSMMYSRLLVARTLLANDGVIFISIDDNEVHHLRKICDEVFGASNFVGQIFNVNNLKGRSDNDFFATAGEYLLCYSKSVNNCIIKGLPAPKEYLKEFDKKDNISNYKEVSLQKTGKNSRRIDRPNMYYPIYFSPENNIFSLTKFENSIEIYPTEINGEEGRWRWGKENLEKNKNTELVARKVGDNWRVYVKMRDIVDGEERTIRAKTLWIDPKFDTGSGGKVFKDLFGNMIFDNPKPLELIKQILIVSSDSDSLILDFFSGSATTAHAVMQLNAEDGGNRKYICVQLPEETPKDSPASKASYNTICEIGKERIRRAGAKIQAEHPEATIDTGFRVLRLDSSNMEEVYFEPATLSQENIFAQVDSVKYDRTELDLLFGCMVDWGVQLSYPLRKEEVAGKHLHIVNEGALVACFDEEINIKAISHIAKMKPLRVIFRESCFATDADKLNIYEQFKQLCGWNQDEVYKRIHVI